jgi:hypothetical protein
MANMGSAPGNAVSAHNTGNSGTFSLYLLGMVDA